MTAPPNTRGPSGTQPHPKGRPVMALSSAKNTKQVVYFIAYRHKSWDKFHRPPPPDDDFIWEFYYSNPTFERAKARILAGEHPRVYAGQFPMGALLHPNIATLLQGGV